MEQHIIKNLLDIKDYKGPKVILSFTILRFIATCLITNTHYNDVYPIKALAVGGLIGDVLFFIVSGFVLAGPIKQKFLPWYWKRIVRIYPTIIVGVAFYIITGYQTLGDLNWFEAFIFPTFFVFTAAIILLYIPFYFVNKVENKKTFLLICAGWILFWGLAYIFILDKSTYEMNNTWNPMIAFPYFSSMLFGAYLRKFGIKKAKRTQIVLYGISSVVILAIYFLATKIIRGNVDLYPVQIIVQIMLLFGISFFVCAAYLLEDWFRKWPVWLLKPINFVAALTLEIYVIQKPIIQALSKIAFPINWLLITVTIIACAVILRIAINAVIICVENGVNKLKIVEGDKLGMKHNFYRNHVKRWLDFICALIMLLIIWPILLIIMVLVKLDSKGPAIFVQNRLTLGGKVFRMYKARTMCVNAEKQGTGAYSFGDDPRITKVGNILRKLSLDELFQLINILKGDMSFVGPRPILTYHPCKYEEYTEKEKTVFTVRPGITGWAQVNGRNSVDWVQRFELNEWYVENVSFLLDMKIVFTTFFQVFSRKEIVIQGETAKAFKERKEEANSDAK